jgi:hypothetical protein
MYQKYVFALLCIVLASPIECGRKDRSYFGNKTNCRTGNSQRTFKKSRKRDKHFKNVKNGKINVPDMRGFIKSVGRGGPNTKSAADVLASDCLRLQGKLKKTKRSETPPILDCPTNDDSIVLSGGNDRGNKTKSQLAKISAAQTVGPVQRHCNPGRVAMLQPYFKGLHKHAGNFQGYEAGTGR